MNKLQKLEMAVYIIGSVFVATCLAAFAVSAATTQISVSGTDTSAAICAKLIAPVTPPAPPPAPSPSPVPPPAPTPPIPPPVGGTSLSFVYITGYADGDNTPPGSPVTFLNGVEGVAKGDCTYANPTTMAVGHVITNGTDVGDFAYGTKFYVPALKCYFSAQDTCGDGPSPQTQPCHSLKTADKGATLWLDAYVGPKGTAACEDAMTKLYSVIENPVSGLPVKVGNICN